MKILALDLESSYLLSGTWGIWQQNISLNQLFDYGSVICYSYKWLGQKEIYYHRWDEDDFLEHIHQALSESDAVLTYNGARFDLPMLNREFIKTGMRPPPPYTHIDLLKTVKKQFRFPSNKLQHVCQELGLGSKVSHEGFDLWVKCLAGDERAWQVMKKYNQGDVKLLEKLYHKLKPWISNHPSELNGCPRCGSNHLQQRGYRTTTSGVSYKRFVCVDCGAWSSDRVSEFKTEKKAI